MAWIEKRGKRHVVIWRELDGTKRSKSAPDRTQARILKADIEKALLEGSYVTAANRSQPFLEYLENVYAGDLSIRAVTRMNYEGVLRKHLQPRLGGVKLEQLSPALMRRVFGELVTESPWVAQMAYRMVRRATSQALREGLLHRDPLDGVKVPAPQRRDVRVLQPQDVNALAAGINPRFRSMVLLSAYGGLRIGELGALRWDDIDLDRNTVSVRRSISTPSGKPEIGPAKTKGSNRTVSIPAWLTRELKAHRLAYANSDGYVFHLENGDLVTHNNFRNHWTRAARAAGVTPAPRFHDLRHTAAAIAIEQGAHPKLIQSRLGHSTITMTMDTYGHLFPTADEQLAAGLEQFEPTEGKVVSL